MTRKFRSLKIIGIVFLLGIVVVFLSISQIAKFLIEKYDEELTGRKITVDLVYFNPFTGYIFLKDLKVFESDKDSVFISFKNLEVNFAMLKLVAGIYEVSDLTIDHPIGNVFQNKSEFNFSDLIAKFSGDSTKQGNKDAVHFNLLNIKIRDGIFYYHEKLIPINYSIIKVNFDSPGIRWDVDTIESKYSFSSGIGKGDVEGDFTFNTKTNAYRLFTNVKYYNLNIIEQYLKEITNYGTFRAVLDAEINASGDLNDSRDVTASGILKVSDFHFGQSPGNDFASFSKLNLVIKEISPKSKIFYFDSVALEHPYFKYEKYDSLDNLQSIFGNGGSNVYAVKNDAEKFNLVIEIANYVKLLLQNFFQSSYKINQLAISGGELKFNDFSINEEFSAGLNPISIISDSIDNKRKLVNVNFKSGLIPYGNVAASLNINPHDSSFFDLDYKVEKVPVSLFNPYFISYSSYPVDRGSIEIAGQWHVRNGIIQSENHIVVIDPRVTSRFKNKNNDWMPLRLMMSFARERGNVIDYEIPITGDLNSPNFHFHDVVSDVFRNIFIKPVTTTYRMEIKEVETVIEKSQHFKWEMCKSSVKPKQEIYIENIVNFLKDNPDASIQISPEEYASKELEYILYFEAKKKYHLRNSSENNSELSYSDSIEIDKYSIKNPDFVKFLNASLNDSMLFTIQDKCKKYVDYSNVTVKFNQLVKSRKKIFMEYFLSKNLEKQIAFLPGINTVPYDGFSFYKIEYKGTIPESLLKSYAKLEHLDNKPPRKKFKGDRKKTVNAQ